VGTIALFGEAEKGDFRYGVLCRNLAEVSTVFGEPPEESLGIFLAVEALLHQQDVLFLECMKRGSPTKTICTD
jgi:hypothetical protein